MKLGRLVLVAASLAVGPIGCSSVPELGNVIGKKESEPKKEAKKVEAKKPEKKPEPKQEPKQNELAAGTANAAPQIASGDAAGPLSAEEVTSLLSGNSVYAGGSGFQFAALHLADGTLKGKTWAGDGSETGAGVWKVEADGSYCRKWENQWAGGEWGCFKVFRDGAALTMERVSGAGANGQMTLVAGNAYDL